MRSRNTSQSTSTTGRLGLALAGIAAAATTAAHLANPRLDPTWVPISDLALGDNGWLMTTGFLAWSGAGFAAVAALSSRLRGFWGRTALACLGVAAAGPLLAGLFPAEPVSVPQTQHGGLAATLHGVGATLPDFLLPASVIIAVLVLRSAATSPASRRVVVAAGAAVWVAAVALTVLMASMLSEPGATLGPDTPLGIPNRVHVATCLGYAAALLVVAPRLPVLGRSRGVRVGRRQPAGQTAPVGTR